METSHFKVTSDLQIAKSGGLFSIFVLVDLSAAPDASDALLADILSLWSLMLKPQNFLPTLLVVLSQFPLFVPCPHGLFIWGCSRLSICFSSHSLQICSLDNPTQYQALNTIYMLKSQTSPKLQILCSALDFTTLFASLIAQTQHANYLPTYTHHQNLIYSATFPFQMIIPSFHLPSPRIFPTHLGCVILFWQRFLYSHGITVNVIFSTLFLICS